MFKLRKWMEKGLFPCAGGYWDQPYVVLQAVELIDRIDSRMTTAQMNRAKK